MDRKWVFNQVFNTITSEISNFECSEVILVIKPIMIRSDRMLFGCYIPAMPRPASIISGKILVNRLENNRTEVQVMDFQPWGEIFVKLLIDHLSVLK
jgi:hypothetical protein